MLPTLTVYITIVTDVAVFFFILYYFLRLRTREKKLEKKETAIDTNYHHVVDDALSKERKILDDAAVEADQIITGAQYITHSSKEEVNTAVKNIVTDIQREGQFIAHTFTTQYTASLQKMSGDSLLEFQTIMASLQTDLQKQIQQFHQTLLPNVEKELTTYKEARLKEIDGAVVSIVQKAAQEIFNKSLSISDHQNLVIESLEKAKKEGVFD